MNICFRIAECRETAAGHEYLGSVDVTTSGIECQQWSSDTPQVPNAAYTDDKFPDGSRELAENYCRNPDDGTDYLWCYTTDPGTRWEECDVPMCSSKSAADCS